MTDSGEWSSDSLNKLWNSLYRDSFYVDCSTDQDEQGLVLLIQCTQDLFKKHLRKCRDTRNELNAVEKELTKKRQDLCAIESEVGRLKMKCCNCALLEKELAEVQKEAREAQSRMDSIAKILRISENLSENDRNQTAYDLVSQYVGKGLQVNVENNRKRKVVSSPKKKAENVRLATDRTQTGRLNPQAGKREILAPIDSPERNSGEEKQLTPQKGRVKFNINSSNEDCPLDDTIKEYIKSNEAELDRLWGGIEVKKDEPDPPVSTSSTWTLKDTRGPKEIDRVSGKALKQTKLGFKSAEKRLDVSKLDGFNGGVASQDDDVDDDIILASPQACSSGGGGGNLSEDFTPTNTTNFKPVATSTQMTSVERMDRTKKQKIDEKPQFLYERDAVRKKEDRAKLQGWSCFECEQYFKSLELTPEEIKKRMNACSRHRNNHDPKLNETPAGFWNPLFPDTPERERLYPAVFGKKKGDRK